ncbi:RNA polymerase sigma factor [Zobellia galactanivorans]|uniref:RNA polymerase ECF-type sigma factor n=1 Tax=Zobellia galactanivorans (strain DSM 12802 / CCUG 47099 / CIP 106680 / NCIMB 13871 / Dsij) TaxID=63186 RepID=G0LA76_ZOBGA|nr:RNA polymerase sigma-70 factor [Zobellia galactanivorans]CAZ95116.1 RNA polymerase ECF-type sigma factor [Zobellia galactanivorans]
MNDIEAVRDLKKGSKVAFKYLFNTYYNRLVAYITTYNHNIAQSEDVVQQTFIRLWDNRQKLDEDQSPKGYLYAIAYNIYCDTLKTKKKQEKLMSVIWERALRDRIEEDMDAKERRIQKMRQVIDSLPPKCKEIIQMNKIQGIKYKDIAGHMGISIKTVEAQMRIAFTKIREAFEDDQLFLFVVLRKFDHHNN